MSDREYKTVYVKVDRVATLVEQMALANAMKDEESFSNFYEEANSLLFYTLRQIEKEEAKKFLESRNNT